jgi:hypothetical protein
MVPVRINANGKARTVEELRTQKKDMHLNAFRYLLAETARDLERIAEEERAAGERPESEGLSALDLDHLLQLIRCKI